MNWKRGLLRLWIVCAVLWMAGSPIWFQQKLVRDKDEFFIWALNSSRENCGERLGPNADFFAIEGCALKGAAMLKNDLHIDEVMSFGNKLPDALALSIAPPTIALFLGIIISWVLRGFGTANDRSHPAIELVATNTVRGKRAISPGS